MQYRKYTFLFIISLCHLRNVLKWKMYFDFDYTLSAVKLLRWNGKGEGANSTNGSARAESQRETETETTERFARSAEKY